MNEGEGTTHLEFIAVRLEINGASEGLEGFERLVIGVILLSLRYHTHHSFKQAYIQVRAKTTIMGGRNDDLVRFPLCTEAPTEGI